MHTTFAGNANGAAHETSCQVVFFAAWTLDTRKCKFFSTHVLQLINLLVNDLQRVVDMLNFFTFLCSAPIGVIAGTIYGCFVLGWTALMGLIGYMLLLPVQVSDLIF